MQEIVTTEQAERVLRLLAIVLPVVGLIAGVVVGAIRKRVTDGALTGLLIGLIGPAAWGLWRVFNAIEGRFGLDSVKGLLINLALFAVIGLAIGVAVGRVLAGRQRSGTA
jgi:hypothetical protein